jgi:hypothetical protein
MNTRGSGVGAMVMPPARRGSRNDAMVTPSDTRGSRQRPKRGEMSCARGEMLLRRDRRSG